MRFSQTIRRGIGVCLQANLKRTPEDIERLAFIPGKIRLVKGAYDESKDITYQSKESVDDAYRTCLEYAFRTREDGIAVACHDREMITYTERLHQEYGAEFEIQMLMGVKEDELYELADKYGVWQHVPYGNKWPSYFYRSVQERRENLLFAACAVVGQLLG